MENTVPAPADKGLITSPVELAAAHGLDIDWSKSCTCCGAAVYDGRCHSWDLEIANRPKNCTCPKGQGPVAEQRPGSGAN